MTAISGTFGFARQFFEAREPRAVAPAIEHRGGEAHAVRSGGAERRKQTRISAHDDQFQSENMREQVVEMQDALALLGAQIAER